MLGNMASLLPRPWGVLAAGCLVAVTAPLTAATQSPSTDAGATRTFNIYLQSRPIGTEETSVTRTPEGWTIAGSGRIGPPIDVTSRHVEIKYDGDWKPLELTIDATVKNRPVHLRTVVASGSATSAFTAFGEPQEHVDPIDPNAVLLPDPFFAPYEAVAARLRTAPQGSTIPLYAAPAGSIVATVGESTTERIQTAQRLIEARRTRLLLQPSTGPAVSADVWGDENGRLLRIAVPAQNLEVIREDIGSVSSRRVLVGRPNDESVRIPAVGFTLAATVSTPANKGQTPLPAVILVGGAGPTDRDEMAFSIPIFGHLAGALADAGFLVVRYDRRGSGQSGGRPESATLTDYAEDLRAAVRYLGDRKDVDRRRLAVVGYGEGGSVAMVAASKENRIKGLVLIATSGLTGAEFNLEQVAANVARSARSEADKQATIDLQRRIQTAVMTGKGWDDIPPPLRRQADVPWFQSILAFDPAKAIQDVDQPLLVLQGLLDKQVLPAHADRLESSAKAGKRKNPVEVTKLPAVNHLLVTATTGDVTEYPSLADQTVAPAVPEAIASWLKKTLPAR